MYPFFLDIRYLSMIASSRCREHLTSLGRAVSGHFILIQAPVYILLTIVSMCNFHFISFIKWLNMTREEY